MGAARRSVVRGALLDVMPSRSALVIISVATLMGGCGDPEATGPVSVASVDVKPSEATVDIGESIPLVATPRDANGNALSGRVVTWSSSHPTSVAVDEDGMVTRTGAGTATITATSEGIRGIGTISEPDPLIFTSLSLGTFHSCGLTGAGIAYCWGKNSEGQLGDGSVINRAVPKPVASGLTFVSVSARGAYHSCGVTTDGVGYCWGSDEKGQLGDGSTLFSPVPLPVAGGLTFASITVERSHTCGITIGGQAYCWGYNGFAGLGDGSKSNSPVPVPVAGGLEWTSVSPGSGHTCGLTTGGTAYCWGANESGQLGIGTNEESLVPVPAAGGLSFTALASRDVHTCGVAFDGSVYCWGSNIFGELGDGTTAGSNLPVQVTGLSRFSTLGAGSYHTCAITLSGSVSCWGANREGQLGIGNTAESHIPIQVWGGHSFAVIGVGCFHTCGVTNAGTTYCWGRNDEGQLGNGSPDDSMIPVAVVARP